MAKKKTPAKTAENAPELNVTYGLLNDGTNTVSVSVDVTNGIVSGLVYVIKDQKQYSFNTELKEV